MYAPGAAQLAMEFKTTDRTTVAFTVSIYLLGFSLAPMVLSPLSEVYGRLIIYHTSNIFFLAFNLGCALSSSISMFIVFRFLAGCAGSAPMTVGGGTIADFATDPQKNNKALRVFALGPLLGPVRHHSLLIYYGKPRKDIVFTRISRSSAPSSEASSRRTSAGDGPFASWSS